jgi:peptidylprolyl isomerase domain and WD repeat-containing protein 1
MSVRRRRGDFEQLYLDNLPAAELYEKSYMHREPISQVSSSSQTNFIVTASVDGHIKVWKKMFIGIEFIKDIRGHGGPVKLMVMSADGMRLATYSDQDKKVKLFDVVNFDMINIVRLEFSPGAIEFVHGREALTSLLAVSEGNKVHLMQPESEPTWVRIVDLHQAEVTSIKFNAAFSTVLSTDSKGFIEYWSCEEDTQPRGLQFTMKTTTDLYCLVKAHTQCMSLTVSPDGHRFALWGEDRLVRVFEFLTGKLSFVFDEQFDSYQAHQENPSSALRLERYEFQKRMEKERALQTADLSGCMAFDESSRLLLYSTYIGLKVVSLESGQLLRVLGKNEGERFLKISLFQGAPMRNTTGRAGAGGTSSQETATDPSLFTSSFNSHRFYIFTKRLPAEVENEHTRYALRDTHNEKQSREEKAQLKAQADRKLAKSAIIHTTMGDIHVKLFPAECPKTVENFTVHALNGYYDLTIFHRVVKNFMIQAGDPEGDGTGGTSIWGEEFEDEFHPNLKHDRPFVLSMANAGPDTNGSQFFITCIACSWLDGRHTVFGRVYRGMDVIRAIEGVPCDRREKPMADIKVTKIDVELAS